jgi:hypothetical protein
LSGRGDEIVEIARTELAQVARCAVARLMTIELNAGLLGDQWLKQRFALYKRQPRDVAAIKVQEVEGVIDESHPALAVARRLRYRPPPTAPAFGPIS